MTTPRDDLRDLLEQAAAAPGDAAAAGRILPLLDLTSLNEGDTAADIERLCARAIEHGVAAVCVYPRFLAPARERLAGSGVRLATVANFPRGGDDLAAAGEEVATAVAAGADEIDVVIPVEAVRAGDVGLAAELVELCREAAPGPRATLKVILETGALGAPEVIAAAARAAVMAGADFLKTSTGKAAVGATPEAAAVLLAVIEEAGGRVGLKVAGGVRTTAQAAAYLHLADRIMGPDWASPATLRFGASALLDDLLAVAADPRRPG